MLFLLEKSVFVPEQSTVHITFYSARIIIPVPFTEYPALTVNRIFTFNSISYLIIPGTPSTQRKTGRIIAVSPWFTHKYNIRIYFSCFVKDFFNCLPIYQFSYVKSEAVYMIFSHPVKNTFDYHS